MYDHLFQQLSANTLLEKLFSHNDTSDSSGSMWRGRSHQLASAVLPVEVWCRDVRGQNLSIASLRAAVSAAGMEARLADPELPVWMAAPLHRYARSLPDFKPAVPFSGQSQVCLDGHGYVALLVHHWLRALPDRLAPDAAWLAREQLAMMVAPAPPAAGRGRL